MSLKIGNQAPEFCLPNQDDEDVCLKDFLGKWLILYFYPKDNTSGCSREAQEFTEMKAEFEAKNAIIVGVSKDSTKSHRNFIEKKELGITLLSDPSAAIIDKFGAWQLKRMAGREYLGIVRFTYLIDPDGKIAAFWRKVKVAGHVEDVMNKLVELQA